MEYALEQQRRIMQTYETDFIRWIDCMIFFFLRRNMMCARFGMYVPT